MGPRCVRRTQWGERRQELLYRLSGAVSNVAIFLPNATAKLLQKPIYIQILQFIFAFCKMLIYNTFKKQKFIYVRMRFI